MSGRSIPTALGASRTPVARGSDRVWAVLVVVGAAYNMFLSGLHSYGAL